MTVVEVGLMGVKPGLNVADKHAPEGQILDRAYAAVLDSPTGPQRVYSGLEVENPSNFWSFFDWNTLEEHEKFARSFGAEAVKELPTIFSHGEFTKHIIMTDPSIIWQSPVTSVTLAYFTTKLSSDARAVILDTVSQAFRNTYGDIEVVRDFGIGWGVEDDFPIRGNSGQTGSLLMTFTGWTSIEASRNHQMTDTFKESLDSIKALRSVKIENFHMECKRLML